MKKIGLNKIETKKEFNRKKLSYRQTEKRSIKNSFA